MSASWRTRSALLVVAFGTCGPAPAEDVPEPDMELLEYLGYWEESDEDWVMIDDRLESDADEKAGSASEDGESAENEDES